MSRQSDRQGQSFDEESGRGQEKFSMEHEERLRKFGGSDGCFCRRSGAKPEWTHRKHALCDEYQHLHAYLANRQE